MANILRTLTDRDLLRRAVTRLTGGIGLGFAGSVAGNLVPVLGRLDLSMSTFGAGMVVGSRIGVPALVGSLVFTALVPTFVAIGWLELGDPYRKISFVIAVGALLGASAVDLSAMLHEAWRRWRGLTGSHERKGADESWKATNLSRLWIWTLAWAAAIVVVGAVLLHQPVGFLLMAIGLVFVFGLINGIATGISDFNPISAAVVVTVLLMAALGLRDALVGLVVSAVMFVATNVATDMQQDRSTGWRLGTSRVLQFRYQASGIAVGAVATIGFAQLFMNAYPVLRLDQTVMAAADQPAQWTSAATYKIVGILRSLSGDGSKQRIAIALGIGIGATMQALRRWVQSRRRFQQLPQSGRHGPAAEWIIDVLLLPSPYAFFFGGFVNVITTAYFAAGGTLASIINARAGRRSASTGAAIPSDMSTVSLVGGGLIAGESLAALTLGVAQIFSLA